MFRNYSECYSYRRYSVGTILVFAPTYKNPLYSTSTPRPQPNRQLFGKAARLTEYRAVRSRAQLVLSWKGITTSYSRTDGTVGFRQEVPGAVLSAFYKLFNGWQRRARGHLTPPPAASSAPPSGPGDQNPGSGTAEPNRPDGANGAPRGETNARRGPTSTSIAQPATLRSLVRTRSTTAARRAAAG
jgi:hypothetical protein